MRETPVQVILDPMLPEGEASLLGGRPRRSPWISVPP